MNKNIHPQYYSGAKIKCACGKLWSVGSTAEETSVAVCANCHPFYTGQEKLMDTRGRVEKFRKRMEKAQGRTKKIKY